MSPRRRKKRYKSKKLIWRNNGQTLSKSGKKKKEHSDSRCLMYSTRKISKKIKLRHIVIKLQEINDKEFWKQQKVTCHVQGRHHKTIRRFLRRNHVGQKGAEWFIQITETQKCQLRILYVAKIVFQKWRNSLFQIGKIWETSSSLGLLVGNA